MNKDNIMTQVKIEKVVLNVGGTTDYLEKGVKLLKLITGEKPAKMRSRKRIPTWGVRPGLEVGAVVTIRKNFENLLKRLLVAKDYKLKKKHLSQNNFSFGVKEYIEIPGEEYDRDIGMKGLNVTVVFSRRGRRINIKKIKRGNLPKKQHVSKQEIIKFMEDKFNTDIK